MSLMLDTKAMLDIIDDVRAVLAGLSCEDSSFYEELLAEMPQFVACGPQSSGKSSVLRRISGVSLPEAGTVCTRIATMIQIRRETTPSVKVELVGPDGKVISSQVTDEGSVRSLVASRQELAIARSQGKSFVDDHTIIVKVSGPTKPNVTLVDLPGFHTDDDADTVVVNELVGRYIAMSGTLVLHVIKGDQDYGGLLGNDFMRKHTSVPRVTVLTHCDKLEDNDKARKLLMHTLDKTSKHSSQTFAINGEVDKKKTNTVNKNNKNDKNNESLSHLGAMDTRIEVGIEALSTHIEERMRNHLQQQYPKAIDKIGASLLQTSCRLAQIEEKEPADVLRQMARKILRNYEEKRQPVLNDVRKILERLCIDIKDHSLAPLSSDLARSCRPFDTHDDMFIGKKIMVQGKSSENLTVEFTGFAQRPNYQPVAKWINPETNETGENDKKKIKSLDSTPDSIVKDILRLADDRGLRNIVHIDRQPIIELFAKQFAQHYTGVIRSAKKEMFDKIRKLFDCVFREGIATTATPVARALQQKLVVLMKDVETRTDLSICAMEEYNTAPDLIFTPNNHYLTELIKKMVESDTEMVTDDGGARHIYHNIRAFIKVQVKLISELACKELTRSILIQCERQFRALLESSLCQYEKHLNEPEKIARERESLRRRKKVLETAMQKMV